MEIKNSDIMLVLTINGTISKEGTKNTVVGKITILDNSDSINLYTLFKNLDAINVKKLTIFSISQLDIQEIFNFSKDHNEYIFIELGIHNFLNILQTENFLEYNKTSLYIFRSMNY
jgi:hypothetical protein